MYALDNDTLSNFTRGKPILVNRILATPPSLLWLPLIVVEEQLRGRLKVLSNLTRLRPDDVVKAYGLLAATLSAVQRFPLLPYTEAAETLYQSWPSEVKRIGTHDCRIAATAIVNGMTVITRNTQHFERIPGVQCEDWSQ